MAAADLTGIATSFQTGHTGASLPMRNGGPPFWRPVPGIPTMAPPLLDAASSVWM